MSFDPSDYRDRSNDPDPFSQVDAGNDDDGAGDGGTPSADERQETIRDSGGDDDDGGGGGSASSTATTTPDNNTSQDRGDVIERATGGASSTPDPDTPTTSETQTRTPSAQDRAETIGGETVQRAADQLDEETPVDVREQDVRLDRSEDGSSVEASVGGSAADEVQSRRQEGLERQTRDRVDARAFSGVDPQANEAQRLDRTSTVVEQRQRAGSQIESQLEEQSGVDLDPGEDFTVERTEDGGFESQLTEQGQRRVAPSQERFGDIPVDSPVSDNRLETDLRRADAAFRDRVADPAGDIAAGVFETANPGASESGTELVRGGVQGAGEVISPAGIALEAKEIGEFVATQPDRVFNTPDDESIETRGSISPVGSAAQRLTANEGRQEFAADVEARGSQTAAAGAEAVREGDVEAIGSTAGGVATASLLGGAAARRIPGVRGSDVTGQTLQAGARATRGASDRVNQAARQLARDDRAMGRIPDDGQITITRTTQRDAEADARGDVDVDTDSLSSVEQRARERTPPREEFNTDAEFRRELLSRIRRIEGQQRDTTPDSGRDTTQQQSAALSDGAAFGGAAEGVRAGLGRDNQQQDSEAVPFGDSQGETMLDPDAALNANQGVGTIPAFDTTLDNGLASAFDTGTRTDADVFTDTDLESDLQTDLGTATPFDSRADTRVTSPLGSPTPVRSDAPSLDDRETDDGQLTDSLSAGDETFATGIAGGEDILGDQSSDSDDEGEGNGLYRDGYESLLR